MQLPIVLFGVLFAGFGFPFTSSMPSCVAAASLPASSAFVQREGINLVARGRRFNVNGFNTFWLLQAAARPGQKHQVEEIFQAAKSLGMNVCRMWAFADGSSNSFKALQTKPGQFDENVFKALDYVVQAAGHNGIRLLLPLVNNWDAYGGKKQYMLWSLQAQGHQSPDTSSTGFVNAFYRDQRAQVYYQRYVQAILTRRNTYTGLQYKDDPTIFGWELINEPRCDGCGSWLLPWVTTMAKFVKRIDSKHLLTVGAEGFFGSGSRWSAQNPPPSNYYQNCGGDFVQLHGITQIDFAAFHGHPHLWLNKGVKLDNEFLTRWVNSHEAATATLQKPVILTEFSYPSSGREQVYATTYNQAYASARARQLYAGCLLWVLNVADHAMADTSLAVYQTDSSIVRLIKIQAARLSA
eukprot:SM000001S04515  [mRNA]  locus=s1:640917:643908:- [translate_table: standard]